MLGDEGGQGGVGEDGRSRCVPSVDSKRGRSIRHDTVKEGLVERIGFAPIRRSPVKTQPPPDGKFGLQESIREARVATWVTKPDDSRSPQRSIVVAGGGALRVDGLHRRFVLSSG
jgi:hypothetical protein